MTDEIEVKIGLRWTDQEGHECRVTNVKGDYCLVAKRLAPRQIQRRVQSVAWVRTAIARED